MAEVLRSHKDPIGVIMKDWTPQGLFDALIEMRENCDKILLNAYNNAQNIQQQHNPKSWMNLMLEA